ncbi:unnamed protein product, partial [Mesorhabditis spiculigera]
MCVFAHKSIEGRKQGGGFGLYGLKELHLFKVEFTLFEVLIFAALISAVDPVAVIAIFEEIHVNEFLFINVFGEALFNDGVTVVLYQMFSTFTAIGPTNLDVGDYAGGVASFFIVAIGGIAIGIIFALLTSIFTKYTHNVKILAPLFVFMLPYAAYLCAEMVSLSPILAISFCGMFMKQYVKGNISNSAQTSIKYFTKMLAQSSETVVFVFLGLSTVSSDHYWDLSFIAATIGLCLLVRTIGVIAQCFILNRFRTKKFSMVDQFILSYGGLRGAIAFGLASSMSGDIGAKSCFLTTTICVIYFTVFLQGITIKPLVDCLSVETRDGRAKTMSEHVYGNYMDHLMSGLEVIAGIKGHNSVRAWFDRINNFYLKPILTRGHVTSNFDEGKIIRAFTKMTIQEVLEAEVPDSTSPNSTPTTTVVQSTIDETEGGAYDNQAYTPEPPRKKMSRQTTMAELLKDQKNVNLLCDMFSEMLDKKLSNAGIRDRINLEDEIADDYIQGVERHEITGHRQNKSFSRADLYADGPSDLASTSQKSDDAHVRREEFRMHTRKRGTIG